MKKMYFYLLITFLASSFFCLQAQAQSQLVPAKLVTTPGDTLNGFINFFDWETSPEKIEFQTSPESPARIYQASEVTSFYLPLQNEWYQAKSIKIHFYLKQIVSETDKIARTVSGTFFLNEVLKSNKVSLFTLLDDEQNTRLFIQKDSILVELIKYKYISFKDGKYYSTEVNQYINQLKWLLMDCNALGISSSLEYSEAALSRLVTKYISCQGETIKHEQASDKPHFNLSIIPGVLKLPEFNPYILSIGVGLKIALPQKFYNRYGLLQLNQYRIITTEDDYRYKGKLYMASFLAGTYFGKSKVQPFIHGGVQFPSVMWFTAGAGISYAKKLNLEIRSMNATGLMFNIHYTFGRINKPKQ